MVYNLQTNTMELSLAQIIERVDEIHSHIHKHHDESNHSVICDNISEISHISKCLSSVLMKVDNIYHICDNTYNTKRQTYKNRDKEFNTNKTDWVHLNKNIKPNTNLTPTIPIKIKNVKTLDEIPNMPIYWVQNINQFAMQINGIIFRGNIGNIYNKNHIKKNKNVHQTVICTNGNNCKILLNNQICKFYHDPVDLLILLNKNIIDSELFNKYKKLPRNFINTSWIYTEMPPNNNNNSMRHFGSRDTLKYDFELMQLNNSKQCNAQISNYNHQCMHDILVIIGLNQFGLLKEYPDIKASEKYVDRANRFTTLSYDS